MKDLIEGLKNLKEAVMRFDSSGQQYVALAGQKISVTYIRDKLLGLIAVAEAGEELQGSLKLFIEQNFVRTEIGTDQPSTEVILKEISKMIAAYDSKVNHNCD